MQIDIESKIKNYQIRLINDFSFLDKIAHIFPKAILIDKSVWTCYESVFSNYIKKDDVILVDAIESNKTIDYALLLCDKILNSDIRKNMTIISIGGGIVQDLSGFLASILYRGINWLFIPTTLLSQADSCMGSKTSLNYKKYKNLLGTFYPPSEIIINVTFTRTLSKADFYSGIGEVVKLHLMGGRENFELISKKIIELDSQRENNLFLSEMVKNSLSIKNSYIKDDEFDTGRRNLLNYGHCFGHALEVASNYAIPHGTAVVIGILFANEVAVKRGLLSSENAETIRNRVLLKSFDFCFKVEDFNKEEVLSALKMDKKRVGTGLPLIVIKDNWELVKLLDLTEEELFDGIDSLVEIINIK